MTHPSREQLAGLALGTLPEPEADQISNHLESCETCDDLMDSLETESDDFLRTIRSPADEGHFADESNCRQMLAAIEAIGREPSFSTAPKEARDLGEAIRDYQLLEKLGQGGMGSVYKALHLQLQKVVALKLLPPERMNDVVAVERFRREMQAIGPLSHENIVKAFDAGEHDGRHYLVMEFVDGVDLSRVMRRVGALPVADACEIARQAALGLQYANDQGLVHRDIKPSNLMLTSAPTPSVKILDLGLARLHAAHHDELTSTGQIMGTLDYMAPEQTDDSHEVDIRADIYSLGATLYKMLCGRAPYATPQCNTPVKKLAALNGPEPTPRLDQQDVSAPDGLVDLLARMTAKDREDRIQTPQEVVDALAAYCADANLGALLAQCLPEDRDQGAGPNETTRDLLAASLTETKSSQRRLADDDAEPSPPAKPGKPQPAPRSSINRRAAALLAVIGALAALVVFIVRTPHGAIVVEIDDPEGTTQVSLDNDRIVIREGTNEGQPIRLTAGRHRLRVQRGSLTFLSDEFKVERGPLRIHVRLVKNSALEVVAGERVLDRRVIENKALRFDGQRTFVSVPGQIVRNPGKLTIEAWVSPRHPVDGAHCMAIGSPGLGAALSASATLGRADEKSRWLFRINRESSQRTRRGPEVDVQAGVTHLAGVWAEGQTTFYVNGKRVETPESPSRNSWTPTEDFFLIGCAAVQNSAGGKPQIHAAFHGTIDEIRVSSSARYLADFTPPARGDRFPADAETLALYHCDEGQGDTLHDASGNGRHGTIHGDAWGAAETPQASQAPNYSLRFNGESDFAESLTAPDLTFDEFTIEALVKRKSGKLVLAGGAPASLFHHNGGWWFGNPMMEGVEALDSPNWIHLAGVFQNGKMYFFHNGNLAGVSRAPQQPRQAVRIWIGAERWPDPNRMQHFFGGWIDEVRISTVARYHKRFDPLRPGERFELDEHTLALYHFDEGEGDIAKDATGNYDAKISGAKYVLHGAR